MHPPCSRCQRLSPCHTMLHQHLTQHAGACPRGFDARTFLEGRPRAVYACARTGVAALLPARVGLSVSVSLFNKELSFSSLLSSLLAYFADIPQTRVDFDLCLDRDFAFLGPLSPLARLDCGFSPSFGTWRWNHWYLATASAKPCGEAPTHTHTHS